MNKIKWHELLRVLFLLVTAVAIMYVTYQTFFVNENPDFYQIVKEHFKAVVGLPAAAIPSFFLVLILKQTAGPIEFKGLSFEFKGTSGEVILWVICLLSIVYSIDKLW